MSRIIVDMETVELDRLHRIGTLKEKTLHHALKNFIEPDINKQEVKIGTYYADILNETGIVEIQTQNFNLLRKKLDFFLPNYVVTIAYPIAYQKWLYWINEETGEISKKRKSPKQNRAYSSFLELYKIKSYLLNPNLRIRLMLVNIEEYRILNGWSEDKKRGSSRHDRIPFELVEEVYIEKIEHYKKLIPSTLCAPFTSKEFAKEAKVTRRMAQTGLNILTYTKAVERIGKKGSSYLYQKA